MFRSLCRSLPTALLALALVSVVLTGLADACPTCKDGLDHQDPASQNIARGYFWSILFMMSMPFLIFGGLGTYFYLEVRKARKSRDTRQGVSAPVSGLRQGSVVGS